LVESKDTWQVGGNGANEWTIDGVSWLYGIGSVQLRSGVHGEVDSRLVDMRPETR
jgi:hypothetical protein